MTMSLYQVSNGSLCEVKKTTFADERILERTHLQEMLKTNIEVILPEALVLAEEYSDWEDSRRRIDLLCLDKDARLVVIELKRNEDGGHMDLQAIRYASMISKMTFSEAVKAYQKYKKCTEDIARSCILDFLEWDELDAEKFAGEVRIILASAEFSKELMTSVMWLSEKDIDICCMKLKPYHLDRKTLIDVQKIFPLPEAEDYQIRIREKEREERDERILRLQNRDLTRFNLTVGSKQHFNLPKRFLAYWIIRAAVDQGAHPHDIIRSSKDWVIVDGTHKSDGFLKAAALKRCEDSSRSEVRRFFTDDDQLFYEGGRTYALTKMWGNQTLSFVNELIDGRKLSDVAYRSAD